MITLDNFENFVPYKILMRGEEYYDTDAVSELEETSPGEWTATVEGTDDYNVEISMNGKEVESWYCDCPYDGEICKHVVAALLAIRDNNKRVSRSAFSKMRIVTKEEEVVQPNVDIKQLLSFISPQEISTFISEYASTNPEFKAAFLKRFISRNRLRHQREKIIEWKSKRFLIVSVTVKSLVIIIVIMITVVIGKLFSIKWIFI